jgi:hypothetical protein
MVQLLHPEIATDTESRNQRAAVDANCSHFGVNTKDGTAILRIRAIGMNCTIPGFKIFSTVTVSGIFPSSAVSLPKNPSVEMELALHFL